MTERQKRPPQTCVVYVCTSCRAAGTPRQPKQDRPGFKLYERLSSALGEHEIDERVELQPARCLSLCPRPCGIAITSRRGCTYLFAEQDPSNSVDDIIRCLELYMKSDGGEMQRADRPASLRGSVVGRIPALGETYDIE